MDRLVEHYGMREEGTRLAAGNGRVELLRTQALLRAALPPAPARILDVGGADGIHAAWLLEDGHDVTLVDLLPEHVERARGRGITAEVGDARGLALPDASFDAVLLLGPLYHLHDRTDRVRAIRAAARMVRPGGLVAAAAITRLSIAVDAVRKGFAGDPDWKPVIRAMAIDGRAPDGSPLDVFACHSSAELAAELADGGLTQVAVHGTEGPAWATIPRDLPGDDPRIDQVVEVARLAGEAGIDGLADASCHLLAVARRPS